MPAWILLVRFLLAGLDRTGFVASAAAISVLDSGRVSVSFCGVSCVGATVPTVACDARLGCAGLMSGARLVAGGRSAGVVMAACRPADRGAVAGDLVGAEAGVAVAGAATGDWTGAEAVSKFAGAVAGDLAGAEAGVTIVGDSTDANARAARAETALEAGAVLVAGAAPEAGAVLAVGPVLVAGAALAAGLALAVGRLAFGAASLTGAALAAGAGSAIGGAGRLGLAIGLVIGSRPNFGLAGLSTTG